MPPPLVCHISACTITPRRSLEGTPPPKLCKLTPWDLAMLSVQRTVKKEMKALCALVWRSVTRARKLSFDQVTNCRLAVGNRSRLQPPLPPYYFGNCIQSVTTTTTVAQLLSNDLGWVGWLVHQSVATHTDAVVRGTLDAWVKAPVLNHLSRFNGWSIMTGSSPRFDMYGNDFGCGRPTAVRSGNANKFDGKVTSYPGREGGGSVDLEICLLPEFMNALDLDVEFVDIVSHSVVF